MKEILLEAHEFIESIISTIKQRFKNIKKGKKNYGRKLIHVLTKREIFIDLKILKHEKI